MRLIDEWEGTETTLSTFGEVIGAKQEVVACVVGVVLVQ